MCLPNDIKLMKTAFLKCKIILTSNYDFMVHNTCMVLADTTRLFLARGYWQDFSTAQRTEYTGTPSGHKLGRQVLGDLWLIGFPLQTRDTFCTLLPSTRASLNGHLCLQSFLLCSSSKLNIHNIFSIFSSESKTLLLNEEEIPGT